MREQNFNLGLVILATLALAAGCGDDKPAPKGEDGGTDGSVIDGSIEDGDGGAHASVAALCDALQKYDLKCKNEWPQCYQFDEEDPGQCPYVGDSAGDFLRCTTSPSTAEGHYDNAIHLSDFSVNVFRSPKYWSADFSDAVTTCMDGATCDVYAEALETCAKAAAVTMGSTDPSLDQDPFVTACLAACGSFDEQCRFVRVAYSNDSLERAAACTATGFISNTNVDCGVCLADPAQCTQADSGFNYYCTNDDDY